MDAYGNYFSNWYDKFMEEQNELLVELAKGSYADLFAGKMTAAEVFKNVPTKMDSIMAMPPQGAVVEKLMKEYPWNGTVAAAMGGNVAGRYVEEMSGSVVAALDLDIRAFNKELAGLATHNAAIKGIVERAVELSTMQGQVDTETAPEDDEVPSAVEEFVENNPEEAERVANKVQSAVSRSINTTKDKWDSFPKSKQIELFLVTYIAFSESAFSTVGSPVTASAIAEVANKLVILLVTYCVIIQGEREENGEED